MIWPCQREAPAKQIGFLLPSTLTSFSLGLGSEFSLSIVTTPFSLESLFKTQIPGPQPETFCRPGVELKNLHF